MIEPEFAANSQAAPRQLWRSFLAILAGFLLVFVLSIAVDIVLHLTGVFPPIGQRMSDSLFILATAYRTVITIFGGYVTARLAPAKPVRHALFLGVIGFIFAMIGVIFTWNAGPEFGPKWYPIMLAVLSLPSCWLGGILYRPRSA